MISIATDTKIERFIQALPGPVAEALRGVAAFKVCGDELQVFCPSESFGRLLYWSACGHLGRAAQTCGVKYVQVWAEGKKLHELSPASGTIIESFYVSESREKVRKARLELQ